MEFVYNPVPHSGIYNISKAKGEYYFDSRGKSYIDLESGIWCTSLGHHHNKINDLIKNQIDQLSHISKKVLPSDMDSIAKKLLYIADFDGKVIFMNTGSEAIEFSMIMARRISKVGKLISFSDNYVSAYGQATQIDDQIDVKPCLKCANQNCSKDCYVIKDKIKENCIFIFDPFCFSRQIIKPPVKLIKTLENELKQKDGILIVDEVTTGLGRTGKWFAYNHFNLKPDMVVLGKSLGNGYPVSAVMIDKTLIRQIEEKGFAYYQSHQNDPLGCKIAEAVLDILNDENLINQSHNLGEIFLSNLQNDLSNLNKVIDIRGIGLLIGIELSKDISVEEVYQSLIKKGIIIGISMKYNMLNIIPPLTINPGLIPIISNKIRQCIMEANEPK